MDTDVAYGMVESLSDILMGKGYQIFIYDLQYDDNPYKIGILKSNDKYDSLRFMLTNGTNYDLDTDDVIGKLKEWDSLYKINLVCVGSDFVEIKLDNPPEDINNFAKEVYQFCPDSVDQGVGSLEALADEIKNTSRVFLWWD